MTTRQLKHFDVIEAKKAYAEGKNITELLRLQKNTLLNTPEIIEAAYDLQAGSYIQYAQKNPKKAAAYTTELASILDSQITETDSLLDVGTGELTTLSHLICNLKKCPKKIFAFDISWSRIYRGNAYAKEVAGNRYKLLSTFVADINEIPLLDKSVSITTSSHALEPNGGRLEELMSELFRITIDKLILFEPCFELNSEEGKKRMERLGYIKDIDGTVKALGGEILEKIAIKNTINPLNPTVCFIITPPPVNGTTSAQADALNSPFSVPGTNIPLKALENYYFSKQAGLCYPTLKGIPILKSNAAILASALDD